MNVMMMDIEGVLVLEPKLFGDARGGFMEIWNRDRYMEAGLCAEFVQDNVSLSSKGVLRGLHFQHPQSQGKLVQVLQGEVMDVAVDIRVGSPTFGQHVSCLLSEENHRQLYVPEGFAHGFCVLSETALFLYKCTDFYNPQAEGGILWNDPALEIDWPISAPLLSERDSHFPCLQDVPRDLLPVYGA